MVVDACLSWHFSAIDIGWFVGHLGVTGKPALFEWITKCSRLDPRASRRPEAESCLLQETPDVTLTAPGNITVGDRTIDLNRPNRHRQVVVTRTDDHAFAVEFDRHLC